MSTTTNNDAVYIRNGNPDTLNVASTGVRPGDVGRAWTDPAGIRRQLIKLDSGATAATPVGVTAANQLAYWKDKSASLVTNDVRMGEAQHNGVAGVFTAALTAGQYGCILKRKRGASVKATGAAYVVGDTAVSNTATPVADVMRVAAGTAPTSQKVGDVIAVAAGGNVTLNIDLPD